MKPLGLLLLLSAVSPLHFDVMDGRGKRPAGVAVEAGNPDVDDWYELKVAKSKAPEEIVWPFDGRAKAPDGPEPIPVLVAQAGDAKYPKVAAALAAASLLGVKRDMPFDAAVLSASEEPFQKGVALLYAHKPADALEPLARALRERERQLTRVPSEIYPAAMLYGKACFEAGKFDDAATVFSKAMKQRSSDKAARAARAEALIKAGKPEAAEGLIVRE